MSLKCSKARQFKKKMQGTKSLAIFHNNKNLDENHSMFVGSKAELGTLEQ